MTETAASDYLIVPITEALDGLRDSISSQADMAKLKRAFLILVTTLLNRLIVLLRAYAAQAAKPPVPANRAQTTHPRQPRLDPATSPRDRARQTGQTPRPIAQSNPAPAPHRPIPPQFTIPSANTHPDINPPQTTPHPPPHPRIPHLTPIPQTRPNRYDIKTNVGFVALSYPSPVLHNPPPTINPIKSPSHPKLPAFR